MKSSGDRRGAGGRGKRLATWACVWALLAGCSSNAEPAAGKACGYQEAATVEPCALAPVECGQCAPTAPTMSEPVQVAPSSLLPADVEGQNAFNNLDIVWHEGRLFFAFRTAPTHFASPRTVLYVVSTTDMKTWVYETSFFLETDLREPRFLSFGGELFLYFAVLGRQPLLFEPKGTMVSQYRGPCAWTEAQPTLEVGFIPWRTKVLNGVPYMIGYYGGEDLYGTSQSALQVHWLTTQDGRSWTPAVPGKPVVLEGGASETDFAFLTDGTLVAVARNEEGDDTGFGSKICRAEAADLGTWQCKADPKKYDSPLVFAHADKIYLIGRRNVTDTGDFDLGMDELSHSEQYLKYQVEYWGTPKRCALWEVDPEQLTVQLIDDLPSRGDTCFASAVRLDEHGYMIFNYTSPLDGPDVGWSEGQQGPTMIYGLTLRLPGG